jgi:hypothetical protein
VLQIHACDFLAFCKLILSSISNLFLLIEMEESVHSHQSTPLFVVVLADLLEQDARTDWTSV